MNIVEKYLPLNSKEAINKLIEGLRQHTGAMNLEIRREIYDHIHKSKLQMYFNDQYPESMFTESGGLIKLPQESLDSKKHIYGTYIEMAFHNFFINMEHIYAIVFGEKIINIAENNYNIDNPQKTWNKDFANENYVWAPMFKRFSNCQLEEKQKVVEMLERHFPILKAVRNYIASEKIIDLDSIEILEQISKSMRILRNYYSHVNPVNYANQINDYNNNEELIKNILEHAFIGARNKIKDRFAYNDDQMKCTRKSEYRLTKKGTSHLTAFGLVFLCCQFLEKKYSKILTDKVHCIPPKDQSVINELIAVYRIRLHQEKLYISKNTDALAFDILTELRRCPQELFDILPPEEQNKFRVASDDEEDADKTLMVRKKDRFAHFVLKYIDDAKLFEQIRFQVSLGNYFYKFYDKYCIDNDPTPRVRALSKRVNGFGRISEIEDARKDLWENCIRTYDEVHKNTPDEKPYITDHQARYVVNGNRIAMHIFEQDLHMHVPELKEDGVQNLAPTCWLSEYELPAMMMLIHLRGGAFVEEIIKSVVANYKKMFLDVADGTLKPVADAASLQDILNKDYGHLQIADIPEDMQNYLTGKACAPRFDFKNSALKTIRSMIEQTTDMLDRFKEQCEKEANTRENKFGKKSYVEIKPGKLASFLAKDIMLFQPNDAANKGKLTSLNFRVMQSMLALYGTGEYDASRLEKMFRAAHILGVGNDEKANPIIMQIWKRKNLPTNTKTFYRAYLEERLNYLKECAEREPQTWYFLHANRTRWQEHNEEFYKSKAGRYLHDESNGTEYDKAIELPRGMFDTYIREELNAIESMKEAAANAQNNMSYLIYGYFKKVMDDDCQPVYEQRRTYTLLNKLYRKSPRDPKKYLSAQEIRIALMRNKPNSLHKEIDKLSPKQKAEEKALMAELLKNLKQNETTLKRYRIQDIILFMIAKKLLTADKNDTNRIEAFKKVKLKDTQTKDVLSQKINFSVKVASRKNYLKTIYQKDLKLKDYAKFYRFASDRRMPSLLDLVRGNSVDKDKISQELDGYDQTHPSILEEVFEYERDYYKNCSNENASEEFSKMIFSDKRYDPDTQKRLSNIRNSFAHFSYPKYWDLGAEAQNKDLPEKAKAISETFKNDIKK